MTEENLTPEEDLLEMQEEGADTIQAEKIIMNQSRANSIFSEEVSMQQSGAVGLKAHTVSMQESGAIALEADDVSITNGGALLLQAENAQVQGSAGVVLANNAELQEVAVLAVASQNLRAEKIQTKILFAGSVEGEVHTVVDTREAILIGLVGGIISGMILLMGRFLFGRNK
ncbi:MAG: hypothetical protein HN392_11830 [Anaerolineae bacterium]|jgi:hypothetical protein|nr:hypothetical protein [Anaerolineae bacterium]MBT7074072.1 hypothetical protein [Anaerolineae bacterium]MBT7782809.1 hypothetical protein [Anaerolineae bacterium]